MGIDELPPGWWLPKGLWLAVATPVPQTPLEFIGNVIREADGDSNYVPVFTTERKAGDYIIGRLIRANPMAFSDPRHLGPILDGLAAFGITHLAFDPTDPNDPDRIPLRAATDELRRRLFPEG